MQDGQRTPRVFRTPRRAAALWLGFAMSFAVAPAYAASIAWIDAPPATATGGDTFTVRWQLQNFTGPISEHQAHYGQTTVLFSWNPTDEGGGVFSAVVRAPNVSAATAGTYAYIVRALDNGVEVLSSSVNVAVGVGATPSTIAWEAAPPATASGGDSFPTQWNLQNFLEPIAENQLHWGPGVVTASSPEQPNTPGSHGYTAPVPNVGQSQTINYIVRALDMGLEVLSTQEDVLVGRGPNAPTVTWVTPPPLQAAAGSQFAAQWRLTNYSDATTRSAVAWGVTSELGRTTEQPGLDGVYSDTITTPGPGQLSGPGTLYYSAIAETDTGIEDHYTDPSAPVYLYRDGVDPVPCSLSVETPNGGQALTPGIAYVLRWSGSVSPGNTVDVRLLKGGVVDRTLASATPTSQMDWTVPADLAAGTDYRIQADNADPGGSCPATSAMFEIRPVVTIDNPASVSVNF